MALAPSHISAASSSVQVDISWIQIIYAKLVGLDVIVVLAQELVVLPVWQAMTSYPRRLRKSLRSNGACFWMEIVLKDVIPVF